MYFPYFGGEVEVWTRLEKLEDTARFERGFFALWAKKSLSSFLDHFRPFILSSCNLGTFSSNLSKFEKNPLNQKRKRKI